MALSKLINLIKKASLVEYVDKNFSQFLFMRARNKIPEFSKNLNFPDNTYIDRQIQNGAQKSPPPPLTTLNKSLC